MPKKTQFTRDKKRKQIFDLFSKNLEIVGQHPKITIEPDWDDVYMCPVCMKLFPRDALSVSKEVADYLTLEDVPPKSLGGKASILTCKICNNTAGTQLERHLVNKLGFQEAMEGLANTAVDGLFRPSNDIALSATIRIQGIRGISIEYHPERSAPEHAKRFAAMMGAGSLKQFSVDFWGRYREGRPDAALLRIAYLRAFGFFGYGFLINHKLMLIRHQIQNPQERLLPHWGTSTIDYPDEVLGINIITEPKEFRSFLVVFDLKTPRKVSRYGVLLPGPSQPGLDVYKWLSVLPEDNRASEFNVVHIPEDDYLRNPRLAFASHSFWEAAATS